MILDTHSGMGEGAGPVKLIAFRRFSVFVKIYFAPASKYESYNLLA
jgi:hypothetical protein